MEDLTPAGTGSRLRGTGRRSPRLGRSCGRMKQAFAAPGLSVAVAAEGRIVWSHTCGFADRERRRGVTPATQFRIGSVSKSLTAAAAARLVQEGRLELDADVARYVPGFRRRGATLRRLGGDLAGIRHYRGAEALSTKHYASVGASLAVFRDDPLVARPGERFAYSSYGFDLLGAALESAAGKPFAAVVRDEVLAPLRMTRTRLDDGRSTTRFYEVTEDRKAIRAPRVDLSNRYPPAGSCRPRPTSRGSAAGSPTRTSSTRRRSGCCSPRNAPPTARPRATGSVSRWARARSDRWQATRATSSAAPLFCSCIRGRESWSR